MEVEVPGAVLAGFNDWLDGYIDQWSKDAAAHMAQLAPTPGRYSADFEQLHPRDDAGRFAEKKLSRSEYKERSKAAFRHVSNAQHLKANSRHLPWAHEPAGQRLNDAMARAHGLRDAPGWHDAVAHLAKVATELADASEGLGLRATHLRRIADSATAALEHTGQLAAHHEAVEGEERQKVADRKRREETRAAVRKRLDGLATTWQRMPTLYAGEAGDDRLDDLVVRASDEESRPLSERRQILGQLEIEALGWLIRMGPTEPGATEDREQHRESVRVVRELAAGARAAGKGLDSLIG